MNDLLKIIDVSHKNLKNFHGRSMKFSIRICVPEQKNGLNIGDLKKVFGNFDTKLRCVCFLRSFFFGSVKNFAVPSFHALSLKYWTVDTFNSTRKKKSKISKVPSLRTHPIFFNHSLKNWQRRFKVKNYIKFVILFHIPESSQSSFHNRIRLRLFLSIQKSEPNEICTHFSLTTEILFDVIRSVKLVTHYGKSKHEREASPAIWIPRSGGKAPWEKAEEIAGGNSGILIRLTFFLVS